MPILDGCRPGAPVRGGVGAALVETPAARGPDAPGEEGKGPAAWP